LIKANRKTLTESCVCVLLRRKLHSTDRFCCLVLIVIAKPQRQADVSREQLLKNLDQLTHFAGSIAENRIVDVKTKRDQVLRLYAALTSFVHIENNRLIDPLI
jgi:hypothetical protein